MTFIYQPKPIEEKLQLILRELHGYWENDVWDMKDPFFDQFRQDKWKSEKRNINFSRFPSPIKEEIKFFFVQPLKDHEIRLTSVLSYSSFLKRFAKFLNTHYENIDSIVEMPFNKAKIKWHTFLINHGIQTSSEKGGIKRTSTYPLLFNRIFRYFELYYDTRDEFEKDFWDCRKIPGARLADSRTGRSLNFTHIPVPFRSLAKRYMKFKIATRSYAQCSIDLRALRLFFCFIHKLQPNWQDLNALSRKEIEKYLSWYYSHTKNLKSAHVKYLFCIRGFLEYIQMAQYPESPEAPVYLLILKEDIPKKPGYSENDVKYIPEGVIEQLDDHLNKLSPRYIPIIILLRATGWRISDILNLKYDTCIERTKQGWYICGDIIKTQILNHRVPITDEVAAVVQTVIEETRTKSTSENNPKKYLFVRFDGRRKGYPPWSGSIRRALNRLAKQYNIVDSKGRTFEFKNHAFRHTKAIELINNGMRLVHVQKWMAHVSPEMTLHYAKIFDETMRKSWEEATKKGLFRIDETGLIEKIDISDIQDEDVIEWEYIRYNLDAVSLPLGYCMKPTKQECATQLNPCLTCRSFCTTTDFIPQFEQEIKETKGLIEHGKMYGRTIWVDKNLALLEHLEIILTILKKGKIHHMAGKKSREYIGEERNDI